MKIDNLEKITADLREKYPEVGIKSIEMNDKTGQATFYLEPTRKSLAFVDAKKGGGIVPHQYRERAATITRDAVSRTNLDLIKKDPYTEDYKDSFKRAIRYYYVDPLVGTAVNLLSSMAAKGFENDIDDENIKNFYDIWALDSNFYEVLEWIFLDLFKVGHVTTYKVLAKYEPRVSNISPIAGQKSKTPKKTTGKESGAKKNIWSKGHLPVAYTVLNPELVNITGNLLFNNVSVTMTLPPELAELLKKPTSEQTEEEKALIKALPSDLKRAAEQGGEYPLDSRLVGQVTYRKQPYERYAKPRTTRVFDSIDYKTSLRQADLSTLDGITNYILKITIGNDEYPVVSQEELETVAQLFNTPSKSFDFVWNHTLNIEKIVSPEIASILGQGKYVQVNDDLTTGLALSRAFIDGGGNVSTAEADLLIKGTMEEINYVRRQVERWIYREYQQIAEAMSFDRFPKIRWDEGLLQNTILYMNTLAQLVDRRMLSYKTALESLGFDYPNEFSNMQTEMPSVEEGILGIIGSPWQQAKGGGFMQPTQNAPTGTPSSGRPSGQTKKKTDNTNPSKQQQQKPANPKKSASIEMDVRNMTARQYAAFLEGAREVLSPEQFATFVEETGKRRFSGGE
jgi:hypothetical protein